MTAFDLIQNLKEELTCSICLNYFTDPVILTCGHSFCSDCLFQCSEGANEALICPECRGGTEYEDVVPNESLKNLAMSGKRLRPHLQGIMGLTTCDQHREREKFFCKEDQSSLCESCVLAPQHKDHQVLPLEKAADNCRKMLKKTLSILQSQEKKFIGKLKNEKVKEEQYKKDANFLKWTMMSEYEKMHLFLWDEEHLHKQRLGQELKDNLAKLGESKSRLSQQIQNLQQMILEVEENLEKAPLQMSQDMKCTLESSEELKLMQPEVASLHTTTFSITGLKAMLKNFHREITLDSKTANPHLILSEDLKSVKYGNVPQDLPDNEERFDLMLVVLGAQNFTSGKHYWEVEVGDKTEWEVGVCQESIPRKGNLFLLTNDTTTLLVFKSQDKLFQWNPEDGYRECQPVQKVGIFLDYDNGHVSFYNVMDGCLIYSPPDMVFRGPLRPYFSPCVPNEKSTPGPLIICPRSKKQSQ